MTHKESLFSGIQPTGNLHLGNYLGAVSQWKKLQEDYDALFCVVDLHAITVAQDPSVLRQKIRDAARVFLASGIDPSKTSIFVQSEVSGHSELCWALTTIARMGDMEKMTQFKDKSGKEGAERASVGLFSYPILMAADILLYDAAIVPVGEDQSQHVELTRVLARRFNEKFGETFVVPELALQKEGMRIMGLDDASKKMSKSAESIYNYIALSDDADLIRKKVMKAQTDSQQGITYSDDRPAVKNLLHIYSQLAERPVEDIVSSYEGKGFGEFKKDLAEVVVDFIVPLQDKMAAISDEDVLAVLEEGKIKAEKIASQKVQEVKKAMGLGM